MYERQTERIGDRIEALSERLFVGRGVELAVFSAFLERGAPRPERIVNVCGGSGIGKSFLLDRFRRLAAAAGRPALTVDLREAGRSAEAAARLILERCGAADAPEGADAAGRCADAVNALAAPDGLVLFLDPCDDLGGIDQWLRERWFPQLRADVLIVMASRRPLQGPWAIDPAWRALIVHLELGRLSYDDVREYGRRIGAADEAELDGLWVRSMGHPLALALIAAGAGGPAARRLELPEQWDALVRHWTEEASDPELAELLSAAAVARRFDQEGLAALRGADVPDALFDRLVQLSCFRRTDHGWGMHDMIRDALRRSFRARKPDAFERCRARWIAHTVERLERKRREGRPVAHETAELLQYVGSPVLRAHYRHAGFSSAYVEDATPATAAEAEAYIRRRRDTAKPVRIRCADPETGTLYRYNLTAEESAMRLRGVEPRLLLAQDPRALRLVRDESGAVAGLIAAVPIHRGTVPYLREAPISRAYFAALPPERLRLHCADPDAPIGWYLLSVDMDDPEREDRRSDIVHIMLDYVLAGGIVVSSPPPLPHYEQSHRSLGFEPVAGAEHEDYGGGAPAITYAIDTRGEKLAEWLRRMVGPVSPPENPVAAPSFALTPKEREVAKHLAGGATNQQIASLMFISEAAVKKHIQSMLGKAGVQNRTQLATRLAEFL
ncbi:LuxR family transcriptional regulator [Paenibacillus sp.]|uniref:LuxR family transcriptional regulator n=1 Tax=Paenibacillus sp. TaxID=58172 RepID=UPI002D37C487|nr:LuxR family transcriptional regulator [Paenibacillus sp.]HZG88414.1 LuxR family transcriptional regulator [Paenibacillus sp.]